MLQNVGAEHTHKINDFFQSLLQQNISAKEIVRKYRLVLELWPYQRNYPQFIDFYKYLFFKMLVSNRENVRSHSRSSTP